MQQKEKKMEEKTTRNLTIFLLLNVVLAIYLIIDFLPEEKLVAFKSVFFIPAASSITQTTKTSEIKIQPIVSSTNYNTNSCLVLGPFNIEEKKVIDFILNKNEQSNLTKVNVLTTYQIYWNLGKDETNAKAIFKKQKENAMANPRFVLTQNNDKNWVVNIAKIFGTDFEVAKLTRELEEKAKNANVGGSWDYATISDKYYYKFEDYKILNPNTINSIEITLMPKKKSC